MDKGYLCYLWFGNNFKNIDGLGLNFDTEYYFTIEEDDSNNIVKIKEHLYENPIPCDFFGNTISSITTIVGENGAGKTSILRFILNNLLTETCMHGEYYIALFKVGNEYKISHTYFGNIFFVDKNKKEKIIKYNEKASIMDFYDSILYLSNVFDGYKELESDICEEQSFTVIATMNCLINKAFNENNKITAYYKKNKVSNPIYEYIIDDTLKYLSNKDFKQIFSKELIGFPNGLSFNISYHRFNKINELYGNFIKNDCVKGYILPKQNFIEKYNKYKESLIKDTIIIDEKKAAFYSACNLLAINYCDYLCSTLNEFDKKFAEFFFSTLSTGEKNGIQVLFEAVNNKHFNISNNDKWLIKMLNSIFENDIFYQYNKKQIVIYFDEYLEDNKQLDKLKKIRKIIKEKGREKIFDLSFTHIIKKDKKAMYSSGELLKLRTLIELYKFSQQVKKRNKPNKNILILFDEWDLYLHPNLQRRGVAELIEIINKLFDGYFVQLIITSNSPYMLSDVPSNCVIAMKSGVSISIEGLGATYGSNIHTLLKNQFFMDTTIGEYAKERINNIFTKLKYQEQEKLNEEKNRIKNEINIIGEPIVRTKLNEMYYERFPQECKNSFVQYENQIKELKEALQNNTAIDKEKLLSLKKSLQDSINAVDKLCEDRSDLYDKD